MNRKSRETCMNSGAVAQLQMSSECYSYKFVTRNQKNMRIHLRKRKSTVSTEKGNNSKKMSSLYLAFNEPNQKVQYEWLKLHVYENPKSILEKEHNKETMLLAETIRSKRLLDGQTTQHGFVSNVRSKINFLTYFEKLVEKKREDSSGNHGNWHSTFVHLKNYCNGRNYTVEQINEHFLEGFKEYLLGSAVGRGEVRLNPNSAQSYYAKVRASLREAFMKKMIKENPCSKVKGVKGKETSRQYLNFEELQKLVATNCENALLKKAFLFSALTGLRWSDVKGLTWNKIKYSESEGYTLFYTQQKTKGIEVLPVSEQAIKILGERSESEEIIFKNLNYHAWMNKQLQQWIENAGINKKITFHCARHSFATLLLTMETSIYTVSKMLGHKNLKTTEIYGKVIDRRKVEAAAKIPSFVF